MALAERRLHKLDQRRRETCPASALVLGMQCGGSDAFSGITANPALGFASDLLVRAGATVMFSEVTEVRDAVHLLSARAKNEEVAQALIREMDWYDRYLERGHSDRSANTSPGNKVGGLSNIVEKALGATAKSGRSAISGVIGPGERAAEERSAVLRHPGRRLRLRHAATGCRHEPPRVHHRAWHALRTGDGAGDQGRAPAPSSPSAGPT